MPLNFYELQKPGNYFIDIYNIWGLKRHDNLNLTLSISIEIETHKFEKRTGLKFNNMNCQQLNELVCK